MRAHSLAIGDSLDEAIEELTAVTLTTLVGMLALALQDGEEGGPGLEEPAAVSVGGSASTAVACAKAAVRLLWAARAARPAVPTIAIGMTGAIGNSGVALGGSGLGGTDCVEVMPQAAAAPVAGPGTSALMGTSELGSSVRLVAPMT